MAKDIEDVLDSTKLATAKENNSYIYYSYLNEDNQVNEPYTTHKVYPIIYEQEALSVITASDGTTTSIASGDGVLNNV